MDISKTHITGNYHVFGFNIIYTPTDIRERYSLNKNEISKAISKLKQEQKNDFFVVSTCNRTEVFCHTQNLDGFIVQFLRFINCPLEDFDLYGFVLSGEKALAHILQVSNGVQSSIPGDYQIIGQIRDAIRTAEEQISFSSFFERFVQNINQCSKHVKTTTNFSTGATSTSYLATQLIKNNEGIHEVLLVGLGSIGSDTLQNLVKNTTINITITNRNEAKSKEMSKELGVKCIPFNTLNSFISENADAVVCATGANNYVIKSNLVHLKKQVLFIDLSVPRNIDPAIASMPKARIFTMHDLEQTRHQHISIRKMELRAVKNIISKYLLEYYEWLNFTSYTPIIKQLKEKLTELKEYELHKNKTSENYNDIERVTNSLVNKIFNRCAQFVNENYKTPSAMTIEQLAKF